jgi:hypothetical protein
MERLELLKRLERFISYFRLLPVASRLMPISLLARRKGIYSRDGFKNLDDFVIPRQRRNKFLLLLPISGVG